MGKQARHKRVRDPGLGAVERYLRRVGLPTRPDGTAYQRRAAADPDWFRRLSAAEDETLALAEDAGADPAAVKEAGRRRYGLLYRDLDTALAEYASRPVAIAAAWLRWWFAHHPPTRRLLDVGCGPGVLTCAYALALPGAEVVGVDAVPEAVSCAEALARRAGARNVSFLLADLTDPTGVPPAGAFDQVVAVTALGDGGLYPQNPSPGVDPFSSVADVDGPGQAFTAPGLAALVERLSQNGWFLAFDRTPYAAQAVRFGAALIHAGVDLELPLAGIESLVEDGEPRTFTRFAGRRRATPSASTTADLAGWLKAVRPPAYGAVWHDELRFEAFKVAGATLVWGVEISYAPYEPAVERREVWAQGPHAYGWVATNKQLREFTRGASAEALVAEYTTYARRLAAKGLRVAFYSATPR